MILRRGPAVSEANRPGGDARRTAVLPVPDSTTVYLRVSGV